MKLRCPVCRQSFPWKPDTRFPDECQICGEHIGHDRDDDDIVMPFVRSNGKTASVDKVYRDMEAGSEVRAHMAAEMAGVPVSEMSGLKITNLNSGGREGDISAPALTGSAQQLNDIIQSNPNVVGFQSAGSQFSGAVQSGPYPNMGEKMRAMTNSNHQELASRNGLPTPPSWDISSMQPKARR